MTVDSVDETTSALRARGGRRRALGWARRAGVTLLGGLLLLAGAVMLVTPGPGLLVILLGLLVLSTEYAWARRRLDRHRAHAAEARRRATGVLRRVRPPRRGGGEPRT